MDFFFNAFMTVLGLGFGLVALYFSLRVLPFLIMAVVTRLTTRKWQAARYQKLVTKGKFETARWAKDHGFATEV